MTKTQLTLLVTGASGNLGRRVVELLLEDAPAAKIIATTRTPDKLADLAQRGVVVRRANFDDPSSLPSAFADADRVFLVSTDAVAGPGPRHEQHRAAIQAATRAGVKHIIYSSASNPEADAALWIAADHHRTEQMLVESGVKWTALRNNLYAESLLWTLPAAVAAGKLFAAAAEGGAAFVAREDCARVAAAVLRSANPTTGGMEVTGPAIVSLREVARIASELTGRMMEYCPITPDERIAQLVGGGLPTFVADLLVAFDLAMATGKFGPTSSVVEELTGRTPMSVAEFLTSQRAALAPPPGV